MSAAGDKMGGERQRCRETEKKREGNGMDGPMRNGFGNSGAGIAGSPGNKSVLTNSNIKAALDSQDKNCGFFSRISIVLPCLLRSLSDFRRPLHLALLRR
jgi:hypothetical protein